jgi:hypothetical protein
VRLEDEDAVATASDILGVPVGSEAPAFLLALGAHVAAGLTAVVCGATAALARKRSGLHSRAGLVYWSSLCWVLVSSTIMAALRWPHDVHLLIIGIAAFGAGTVGFVSRLRRKRRWQVVHIAFMGGSYVALLTGFYVDNGPHLPAWRHLPGWAFWVLPAAVGAPVIARAMWKRRREDTR